MEQAAGVRHGYSWIAQELLDHQAEQFPLEPVERLQHGLRVRCTHDPVDVPEPCTRITHGPRHSA
jgi:hypothetical protein